GVVARGVAAAPRVPQRVVVRCEARATRRAMPPHGRSVPRQRRASGTERCAVRDTRRRDTRGARCAVRDARRFDTLLAWENIPARAGIDRAETIAGRRRGPAELPAGTIIGGKYSVERTLGEGGMGVVVVAKRLDGDERVAIKVLRAESLKSKETVARFEREARAVAKIGGRHVARIVDFGQLEGGAQYLAMEYLEGEDLAKLLRRRG